MFGNLTLKKNHCTYPYFFSFIHYFMRYYLYFLTVRLKFYTILDHPCCKTICHANYNYCWLVNDIKITFVINFQYDL
jgi:hypothetical protein